MRRACRGTMAYVAGSWSLAYIDRAGAMGSPLVVKRKAKRWHRL